MSLRKLAILVLTPALLCACAQHRHTSLATSETSHMAFDTATAAPQTATHFNPSAEEMTRRFLKLIESIQSKNDINPRHIEQVLRVPITSTGDDDGSYVYRGQLIDGREYSIVYYPGPVKNHLDQPHSVLFEINGRSCIVPFGLIQNSVIIKGIKSLFPFEDMTTGGERSSWLYMSYPSDFFVKIGASGRYKCGMDKEKDCINNIVIEAAQPTDKGDAQ